ncbi:MAG TPA: sigma factor-like helix-turn-helix DNA-binding protein [Terracidiphilus sp.]|jgi:hypothetical protein|nr:sigma factor-like helix-turn-helix DNA-binding protein [Terracidiphilus sp.]
MSAAFQLPTLWGSATSDSGWVIFATREELTRKPGPPAIQKSARPAPEPIVSLAFYRKHTESLLRRYLYSSMQIGRSPSILGDPILRGGASSQTLRTFEDTVIFVLDMETCLGKLNQLDRDLLSRVVLQEYSHHEAAALLGMSCRTIANRLPQALDRLTEGLLQSGLLVLTRS